MDFLKDCLAALTGKVWVAFLGYGDNKILIEQDRKYSALKKRVLQDYHENELTYELW